MGSGIIVRPARAADYRFSQYHNQAASGTLHKNLTAMWEAVRVETNGRVETTVYAENNKLPGGDPDALKMLIAGEIQFFTLMGGIIGTVVPVAEAQQLPFAFKNAAEAHKAIDGPLGRYIGQEMAAKGLHLFPVAGFDNGMRQVAAISRPIVSPDDFAGMKIRVPPGQMMLDTFAAFGAQPVTTPANKIYDSLKSGVVDAQENPLAILQGFKLYELVKYVSLTNHMWSGFNAMAHPATWNALPDDIKSRDRTQCHRSMCASSARTRARSTPACATILSGAAWCSTKSTRPHSAPSFPASMRAGRKNSDRNAGRWWRQRPGSWADARIVTNEAARVHYPDRQRSCNLAARHTGAAAAEDQAYRDCPYY